MRDFPGISDQSENSRSRITVKLPGTSSPAVSARCADRLDLGLISIRFAMGRDVS
jgi:hypothetical protein